MRNIVLLDATNPRSLRFQVEGVQQALQRPGEDTGGAIVGLEQSGIQLTEWTIGGIPELPELRQAFMTLSQETVVLSDMLAARYFSVSEPGGSLF